MDRVLDTLANIAQDAQSIRSTQFGRPSPFSRAVLESTEWFTATRIREAEAQERALFLPCSSSGTSMLSVSAEGGGAESDARKRSRKTWTAVKRMPPERRQRVEQPTPLKKATVAASRGSADTARLAEDAERCLRAAQKLLQVYVMPRAKEHVENLLARFEAVTDSISERQETSSKNKSTENTSKQVQTEELEIIALRDLLETLKNKNITLDAKLKKRKKPKNEPNAERLPSKREKPLSPPANPQTPNKSKRDETVLSSNEQTISLSLTHTPVPAPVAVAVEAKETLSITTPVHITTESVPQISPPPPQLSTNTTTTDVPTLDIPTATEDMQLAAEPEPPVSAEENIEKSEHLSRQKNLAEELAVGLWEKIGHVLSAFANKPPVEGDKPSLTETLNALINICESSLDQSSSGSISSSGINTDTLSPGAILEAYLLVQFFNSLLDDSASSSIVIRPSHLNPDQKLPFFRYSEMKSILGEEARRRGWGEELSTKAIYGLVGKRCLRIDRRERDPLLAWDIEVQGSL